MNIPEIQTIIEKFSSKKFFASLVGMWLVYQIEIPLEYLWIKVVGITAIAISEVVFQARLDAE